MSNSSQLGNWLVIKMNETFLSQDFETPLKWKEVLNKVMIKNRKFKKRRQAFPTHRKFYFRHQIFSISLKEHLIFICLFTLEMFLKVVLFVVWFAFIFVVSGRHRRFFISPSPIRCNFINSEKRTNFFANHHFFSISSKYMDNCF